MHPRVIRLSIDSPFIFIFVTFFKFLSFLHKMHDTKINAYICKLYLPSFHLSYTHILATYTLNNHI